MEWGRGLAAAYSVLPVLTMLVGYLDWLYSWLWRPPSPVYQCSMIDVSPLHQGDWHTVLVSSPVHASQFFLMAGVYMELQWAFLWESFITLGAIVRVISSVHPLVFKQLLSSFEPQFTVITLKRFCSCVSELVPFTEPTALESPSAVTTSSSHSFSSDGGPRDLPNMKHTGIYEVERGRTGGIIKGVLITCIK